MKVRTIKRFVDKYSGDNVAVGTELEITEERFGELVVGPRTPFVEEIAEEPTEEEPTEDSADKKEENEEVVAETVNEVAEVKPEAPKPPKPSNTRNKK